MDGEELTQKLWQWVENAMYICVMGALWLLCSLPIITVGAATVGLYTVFFRKIALGEKGMVKPFFSAFRESFRPATALWLLLLAAGGLLSVDAWYYLVYTGGGGYRLVLGVTVLVLLAAVLAVYLYVFPLLACYGATAGQTLLSAAKYAGRTWWWTLAGLAVTAAVPAFILAGGWQIAVFGEGIIAFSCTYFMLRAFRRDLPGGRGPVKIAWEDGAA